MFKSNSMHLLVLSNVFLLAHLLLTSSGLMVIDNGLGLPVYDFESEKGIVDYALLSADQKASLPNQVKVRCHFFDTLPFQFTICLSATSDAFLTSLQFFQLLRHSGNPWISLYMDPVPKPGKQDGLFRLTVL